MSLFNRVRNAITGTALKISPAKPVGPMGPREDLFRVLHQGSFQECYYFFSNHFDQKRASTRASFDDVLRKINLGADATLLHEVQDHACISHRWSLKALDIIIEDRNEDGTRRFSADERLQLAYAIRAVHAAFIAPNKLAAALITKDTVRKAVSHGQPEMITFLGLIGAQFDRDLLPEAASPSYNRKASADATVNALLPLIGNDVNGRRSDRNIGHVLAHKWDLKNFKRMEELGLEKEAMGRITEPTYAHEVACGGCTKTEDPKKEGIAFAEYLVAAGYPVDTPTDTSSSLVWRSEPKRETPTDRAMRTGRIAVGNVFLRHGAEANLRQMLAAITSLSKDSDLSDDVAQMIEIFREKGALDGPMIEKTIKAIDQMIREDTDIVARLSPVARLLTVKPARRSGFAKKSGIVVNPD